VKPNVYVMMDFTDHVKLVTVFQKKKLVSVNVDQNTHGMNIGEIWNQSSIWNVMANIIILFLMKSGLSNTILKYLKVAFACQVISDIQMDVVFGTNNGVLLSSGKIMVTVPKMNSTLTANMIMVIVVMELIFASNQKPLMLPSVNLVVNAMMGTTETQSMVSVSRWDQFVIILVMSVGTILNLFPAMFKTGSNIQCTVVKDGKTNGHSQMSPVFAIIKWVNNVELMVFATVQEPAMHSTTMVNVFHGTNAQDMHLNVHQTKFTTIVTRVTNLSVVINQ